MFNKKPKQRTKSNLRNKYREFLLRTNIKLVMAINENPDPEQGWKCAIDHHQNMVKSYAERWNCSEEQAWERCEQNFAYNQEAEMLKRMGFDDDFC